MPQASGREERPRESLEEDPQALLEERLRAVAVLGAGGKMGSGIAWVVLKAMADLDARANGAPGSGGFGLVLIDANPASFRKLREYLRSQLLKAAEKGIGDLRAWARDRADLIENGEIIRAYVDGAMSMVRYEADPSGARSARLVFEAVFEDLALKRELYARLKTLAAPDAYFLTNTSSIPISLLDREAGLDGRILGFHFYNPPAVQKLVEMIPGKGTRPGLTALGRDLGKAFGKTVVPSRDLAGFIGNGHFMRELLFAFRKLRDMGASAESLFALDRVTRDFLIRPMGLFQLSDYVGLDVVRMILAVMREHADPASGEGTRFADPTVDALLAAGVRGGQAGSGEPKDGLFAYAGGKIAGVLDLEAALSGRGAAYLPLGEARFAKAAEGLGPPPRGHAPWSALAKDPEKRGKIAAYLANLAAAEGAGARLAREFLDHSRGAGETLVRTGVAATGEDVAQVVKLGFYHLYGPGDWTGDRPRGAAGGGHA